MPRRTVAAVARSACAVVASAMAWQPALPPAAADEGAWAEHVGPFPPSFFESFTASMASPDFVYKFVAQGEGVTAVNLQSVSMHYTGYLLDGE